MISSHCTWLVVVGGRDDDCPITHPNTIMIVELGKSINYYNYVNYIYTVHNDSQWTVGCILDSTKLCTDEYQKKLMNALIHGRQHWSEKFISSKDIKPLEETTESLVKQLKLSNQVKYI